MSNSTQRGLLVVLSSRLIAVEHYKIAVINSILGLYPSDLPEIPLRALKYSPNITLSFVLLNENSAEGNYVRSWDIEGAIRGMCLVLWL
jgi:phosphatidylinositol glycan class S